MDTDIKKVPQRFKPSPEESSCMSESPTNKLLPLQKAADEEKSELPEIAVSHKGAKQETDENTPDELLATFM